MRGLYMKRFEEFSKHLEVLKRANEQDFSNEFIISGIIDKFYIEFELGWKVLKEMLKYEGVAEAVTGSPRTIIKAAYKYYDFIEEDTWLGMLRERNDTTYIYNEDAAKQLLQNILHRYIDAFVILHREFIERYSALKS